MSSHATPNTSPVVVVSGLPRSGTSMMMRMLEAGGLPLLTDDARPADRHNPKGYYEFAPVKKLKSDNTWLTAGQGRAIKVISYLLPFLPPGLQYRVIFMERDIEEVLASQRRMLSTPFDHGEDLVALAFERDLQKARQWMNDQPNVSGLRVSYADTVEHPDRTARKLTAFLGGALDEAAMLETVDPALRHHRAKG